MAMRIGFWLGLAGGMWRRCAVVTACRVYGVVQLGFGFGERVAWVVQFRCGWERPCASLYGLDGATCYVMSSFDIM